jgi:hypothetical protein
LASNSKSCLNLPSARILELYHHTWFPSVFLMTLSGGSYNFLTLQTRKPWFSPIWGLVPYRHIGFGPQIQYGAISKSHGSAFELEGAGRASPLLNRHQISHSGHPVKRRPSELLCSKPVCLPSKATALGRTGSAFPCLQWVHMAAP